MADNLLPCPFCGSAAHAVHNTGPVVCRECKVILSKEWWQRRAPHPDTAELERLHAALAQPGGAVGGNQRLILGAVGGVAIRHGAPA